MYSYELLFNWDMDIMDDHRNVLCVWNINKINRKIIKALMNKPKIIQWDWPTYLKGGQHPSSVLCSMPAI